MKINKLENDNYEVTFEKNETFLMTLDEVVRLLHVPVPQLPRIKTTQEIFDEFWESEPVFPKE